MRAVNDDQWNNSRRFEYLFPWHWQSSAIRPWHRFNERFLLITNTCACCRWICAEYIKCNGPGHTHATGTIENSWPTRKRGCNNTTRGQHDHSANLRSRIGDRGQCAPFGWMCPFGKNRVDARKIEPLKKSLDHSNRDQQFPTHPSRPRCDHSEKCARCTGNYYQRLSTIALG